MTVRIYFEKRDGWVGYFWDPPGRLYICILPYLPIRITWRER